MNPIRSSGPRPGLRLAADGAARRLRAPASLPALWLVALATASAQPSAPARPDPLDPAAAVPPATHASPLARYRATTDTAVAPWRESNEIVNRVGGWRVYAREAQAPQPPSTSAPAAASPSAPAAPPVPPASTSHHGGHGAHAGKPKGAAP